MGFDSAGAAGNPYLEPTSYGSAEVNYTQPEEPDYAAMLEEYDLLNAEPQNVDVPSDLYNMVA